MYCSWKNLFRPTLNTPSTNLHFVIKNSPVKSKQMSNSLLKDALLTCKRCPLSLLLTPFWSSIKHLLKNTPATFWHTTTYKGIKRTPFLALFQTYRCFLCNNISTPKQHNIKAQSAIRPQYVLCLLLWYCFLTSFIFLSASCLPL